MSKRSSATSKSVNLALQGGGAHGAFTWGVLDCLLQDQRVAIEGISGTSAGAMNAVVLADGLQRDGREGGRLALHDFWKAVSDAASFSPLQRSPLDILMNNWSLDHSPAYLMFDLFSRVASPYDFNPLDINPLADLLDEQVNFDNVRRCDQIKLFISATNVQTGRIKVFERDELTPDHVMASACLPLIFKAVEIEGVPYWDGGYTGNPALFPFFQHCVSNDIVIVQINPLEIEETPKSAREILNRMNEITFNSSLMRELRSIDFVSRLLEEHKLDTQHYSQMLVHRINSDELLTLDASSKLNAEWDFLLHLHDIGQRAAEQWLKQNYKLLGKQSSIDVRSMFA